jgi:hypothetical protein
MVKFGDGATDAEAVMLKLAFENFSLVVDGPVGLAALIVVAAILGMVARFYRRPMPLALWPRQSGMMLTVRPPQCVQTKRRRSAIDGNGARSSTPAASKVTEAE